MSEPSALPLGRRSCKNCTVPGKTLPIQSQTSPLPESFVGAAWDQFETIQWTHDFDKWWDDYGREYREHTLAGGNAEEMAEQKGKIAGMRKLLAVVWIESRVAYLKSIEGGAVRFS